MRKLIISDTHLGLNKDNPVWHEVILSLFKEIEEVCEKNDIEEIFHLGDIFDNPKSITQKTHNIALQAIEIIKKRKIYLIRGNHDTFHKDRPYPNWLNMFNEHNNVISIIDKPYNIDNICLVPWETDFRDVETDYLFGHFEINSFFYNDYKECTKSKLNISDFKKFKKVYSGHFHNRMSKDNIDYVGSPFQQNFGDVGSVRGYHIFDGGEIEFIEFTNTPKFVKIKTNEDIESIKEVIQGNFVKLIFMEDYGNSKNTKIVEIVNKMCPMTISIDTSQIETQEELKQEEDLIIKNSKEILIDYLGKIEVPENIKREMLVTLVNKMLEDI